MIISKNTNSFTIDVKRFYLPFQITCVCLKCKEVLSYDFAETYLSYPKVGEPFDFTLWCGNCGSEIAIKLQLDFSLKIAELDESKPRYEFKTESGNFGLYDNKNKRMLNTSEVEMIMNHNEVGEGVQP